MLEEPVLLHDKDLDRINRDNIAKSLYDHYKNNKIFKKLALYGTFLIKYDEPDIDSKLYKNEYNELLKLHIKSEDLNIIHNYVMRHLHPKIRKYFTLDISKL
jgi:hypothetical protein